jgi:hypothetical protein
MYGDLLQAVQALLVATKAFPSVVCGVGAPDAGYPALNLWLHKGTEVSGKTDTQEDVQILVQVQSYSGDDKEDAYLALMDLVAIAKRALNRARLPGRGAQQLAVPDVEAIRLPDNGPMVYVLRVTVRINPSSFTTS